MAYLLDKDGVFEVRKSLQGEDSGNGVFCIDSVKAGTILPYTAVAFKESNAPDDMDRCYVIAADFNNSKGNARTSHTYSVDGNPLVEPIKSLEEYKKLGCQINEGTKPSRPNCLFAINPFIKKDDYKKSLENQEPIVATMVVVLHDLEPGTELLTHYGGEYSDRDYKPCKLKRSEHDMMVDKAYDYVDLLLEPTQETVVELSQEDEPEPKRSKTEES